MTSAVVVVAAALAGLLTGRPRRDHRLGAVLPRSGADEAAGVEEQRSPARIGLAIAGLIAPIAVLGGSVGVAIGLLAAVTISVAPVRAKPPMVAPDEVPFVVDLIAGCLDVGASLPAALEAAGAASVGLLQERCLSVAAALRSGATGSDAWQPWADDPSLAGFARTAARTSQTGAAAAEDFRQAAGRLRSRRRAAAEQRVRQASVWLVVPLGLCFLPAFILVAVVPIVLGLFPSLHL